MPTLPQTVDLLAVLADPTRVRLLSLLDDTELSVAELTRITDLPQQGWIYGMVQGQRRTAGPLQPGKVAVYRRPIGAAQGLQGGGIQGHGKPGVSGAVKHRPGRGACLEQLAQGTRAEPGGAAQRQPIGERIPVVTVLAVGHRYFPIGLPGHTACTAVLFAVCI